MCSVLLPRHYEAQKHPTAAPYFISLGLRREVPERRERGATLRRTEVIMMVALTVLVFLVSGQWLRCRKRSRPFSRAGCVT